ncbi:MAG: hypothetical protein NVS3B2_11800 [Ramlibacter sp.]
MPPSTLPLCAVMLLDFAGTADGPARHPAVIRKRAHRLLGNALRGLPQESRLAVESGASAVVCFVGDPEDALHAALLLRDQVVHRFDGELSVRVALNLGPVSVAADTGDRFNVTGEGILQAAQIKDRARPNEVLASHSFHRLLAQLNPDRASRFVDHAPGEPLSPKVYAAATGGASSAPVDNRLPAALPAGTGPAPLFANSSLDDLVMREIEDDLAAEIGPMAQALVRKLGRRAQSARELRDTLATAIPDPSARRSFQSPHAPFRRDAPRARGTTRHLDVTPGELNVIQHTLQRFIGTLAPPLMQREIEACQQFLEFVHALAAGIADAQQRALFLQSLQLALPERRL